jgi:hypothetical protein
MNCSYEILFVSVLSPRIATVMEVGKKEKKHYHKTFGYAEVPLKKPSEYLKKNSRILPPRPKIGMQNYKQQRI